MRSNFMQVVATIAVVAIVLGVAALAPSDGQTSTRVVSASSVGSNGLLLSLSVNSTSVAPGDTLGITVGEYNTHASRDNVSQNSQWLVRGQLGSCGDGVYPYGVSAYAGRWGAGNVSQATPVRVFPLLPCPLFIRLVTGYLFQPTSDNATILPGTGSVQMSSQLGVNRDYGSGNPQGQPLPPGTYTIAASDEWGNAAFLYVSFS